MIEVRKISKSFDNFQAVNDVTVTITDKNVFGLVGTNGAGKSTVLRMIAGVYKPDEGIVLVDRQPVFDKMETKRKLFFIADEPYFFNNATAEDMLKYYASIYEKFDKEQFYRYLTHFDLNKRRKINTYSKGMKKQLALLLGICAKTKYLLCDETFDGLDPVMRQGIKSIFAEEIERRGMTPVIASHNLRELEDICDHVGLLHKGGVLLSKDLEEMKLNIQKVQCVFKSPEGEKKVMGALNILKDERRGSLHTFTVRGNRETIMELFKKTDTVFCEVLPLSLEEIFISETEVVGYDVKKLILG